MSIKVMSMIWDRFNVSGGELNLALALGDHSSDGGESIFPGVSTLCHMTRQHERTVQRQLARFREIGWLEVVAEGGLVGGRGRATVYRINPAWIKGGKLPGFPDVGDPAVEPEKGGAAPGFEAGDKPVDGGSKPRQCVPETPAMDTQKGGAGATPSVINHQDPGGPPPRATPSGSRDVPLDRKDPRAMHWGAVAQSWVISECAAMGICKYGTTEWRGLPTNVRMVMPDKMDALVAWALDQERPPALKTYKVIERHLQCELTLELRVFKPSTPADRQAGYG